MLNAVRADARFSAVPANTDISRSTFDRNSTHKTTCNVGKLVPFYLDEVLPGDTFDLDTSYLARMSTPIYPVMDDAYMDVFYFFVPTRLVYDDSRHLFGEPREAWFSAVETLVPTTRLTPKLGGVADHFGLPVGKQLTVNAMPFRAYQLIYNEFFRDQNLTDPVVINKSYTTDDEYLKYVKSRVEDLKQYAG